MSVNSLKSYRKDSVFALRTTELHQILGQVSGNPVAIFVYKRAITQKYGVKGLKVPTEPVKLE